MYSGDDLGLWRAALHGFLPDSSQPIPKVIVGTLMAIRWLEVHDRKNNWQEAPTKEQLEELDSLKALDIFGTMRKIIKIKKTPMKVKKTWTRRRLIAWFIANMTACVYKYAKKHLSKHSIVYSSYKLDIGPEAFKRAFVTHPNAVTTAVKGTLNTIDCDRSKNEETLKDHLGKNLTLCLHNSF